ncbi:MAG: DUF971 domain-containing protein [Burkholderiales bacterium]
MIAVLSHAGTMERSIQPLAILTCKANRMLEIDWPEGGTTSLTHRQLRLGCRCAECGALRQRGDELVASVDIMVTDIVSYGSNALRLTFSDGHSRGIFPFQYLRELTKQDA